MGDDLDDVGFAVAGIAHFQQFGSRDFAHVGDQGAGKPDGDGRLFIPAGAGAVGLDLGAIQARLAADCRVRRQAILATVLLGQGEGDALARLRVERAVAGDAVQAQECLEGGRGVGEDLEEIGHHAKLGMDGVVEGLLFRIGRLGGNDVDACHDVSPVRGWV